MDVLLPFFAQYYNEWSVLHMSENGNQSREWLHYGCRRSCDRPRKHLEIRISRLVEKVTKIIMPVLFLFLIICVSEQCS